MTSSALVPFESIQKMAEVAAKSKLFGAQTPEQALTIMLIAQSEGRHPMSAAKDYSIINGKPSKNAEAMLRDFLLSGGSVKWHKYADDGADATFTHPQGGEVRVDWDKARMEKAQISNAQMYNKYPRAMYRARCISEGVRTVCPSATGGLYVPDEVRSFAQPEKNMGAAVVVPQTYEDLPKVDPAQIDAIHTAMSEAGVTLEAVLAKAELADLKEMAATDAPGCIKWIKAQKAKK
jgi:hypothetical protein